MIFILRLSQRFILLKLTSRWCKSTSTLDVTYRETHESAKQTQAPYFQAVKSDEFSWKFIWSSIILTAISCWSHIIPHDQLELGKYRDIPSANKLTPGSPFTHFGKIKCPPSLQRVSVVKSWVSGAVVIKISCQFARLSKSSKARRVVP